MFSYANKFTVLSNGDKTEVLLRFEQITPEAARLPVEGTTGIPATKTETVADIVVTGELGKEIAKLIAKTLEQE